MAFCTVCWFRYPFRYREDTEAVSGIPHFAAATWIPVATGTDDKRYRSASCCRKRDAAYAEEYADAFDATDGEGVDYAVVDVAESEVDEAADDVEFDCGIANATREKENDDARPRVPVLIADDAAANGAAGNEAVALVARDVAEFDTGTCCVVRECRTKSDAPD